MSGSRIRFTKSYNKANEKVEMGFSRKSSHESKNDISVVVVVVPSLNKERVWGLWGWIHRVRRLVAEEGT